MLADSNPDCGFPLAYGSALSQALFIRPVQVCGNNIKGISPPLTRYCPSLGSTQKWGALG